MGQQLGVTLLTRVQSNWPLRGSSTQKRLCQSTEDNSKMEPHLAKAQLFPFFKDPNSEFLLLNWALKKADYLERNFSVFSSEHEKNNLGFFNCYLVGVLSGDLG